MSIRATLSLNIEAFKKTLSELPAKTKSAFSRMSADVKGFFSAFRSELNGANLSLSKFARAQFLGGGALGIITSAFRQVGQYIAKLFADIAQRAADRFDQLKANAEQYNDLRSAQSKRTSANREALRTLESQQFNDRELNNVEREQRDIALRQLKKSFPQLDVKLDDQGRVRNFGGLQSFVINQDEAKSLELIRAQIAQMQRAKEEADRFFKEYNLDSVAGQAKFISQDKLTGGFLMQQYNDMIKQRADAVKQLNSLRDQERELERSTAAEDAFGLFRARQLDRAAEKKPEPVPEPAAPSRWTEQMIRLGIRADSLTARGGFVGGAAVTQETTWRQGVASDLKTLNNTIGSISGSVRTIEQETRL